MTLAMSLFTFEMYILPVQKIPYKCLFEKKSPKNIENWHLHCFPYRILSLTLQLHSAKTRWDKSRNNSNDRTRQQSNLQAQVPNSRAVVQKALKMSITLSRCEVNYYLLNQLESCP